MNNYFGPLSKKYCIYFYYLSIFFFIIYVISLISFAVFIVKHYNKVNLAYIVNFGMILINTLLGYFVNRLLHSMCMNSLN
jgi:uncharacterized membrane protein (DUF485 family)